MRKRLLQFRHWLTLKILGWLGVTYAFQQERALLDGLRRDLNATVEAGNKNFVAMSNQLVLHTDLLKRWSEKSGTLHAIEQAHALQLRKRSEAVKAKTNGHIEIEPSPIQLMGE